jgi:DMSO/TMAO reductase YedYZ heme-binding membrane subunit
VLHYLWLERDFHRAAWLYAAIVALLLFLRLTIVRQHLRLLRG